MKRRQLVLCVGMHRSGTSVTASLLEAIGLRLPGQLISADGHNPRGYFENRSVVEAQERLLQDLGCWWPTEAASHGLPKRLRRSELYRTYQNWLTTYLEESFANEGRLQLAIKDPRSSLLLPAWRVAATRLDLELKLVICLRNPRDVCWSLVWRDGPLVGMGWKRAQRLWLQHYRALLVEGYGLPAMVVLYEHWLAPKLAVPQLEALTQFLGLIPSPELKAAALRRVQPELNHGGDQLPRVANSVRWLHRALEQTTSRCPNRRLGLLARCCRLTFSVEQKMVEARSHWQLLSLLTLPDKHKRLEPALDRQLLRKQLGGSSLWWYWWNYRRYEDLRPHPLISPAFMNQERQRCGLAPFCSAGDLFRHLLDADLNPLNPHPWFDCRTYQHRSQLLGHAGEHPVVTYLRRAAQGVANPYPSLQSLEQLGASRPLSQLGVLPPAIQQQTSTLGPEEDLE